MEYIFDNEDKIRDSLHTNIPASAQLNLLVIFLNMDGFGFATELLDLHSWISIILNNRSINEFFYLYKAMAELEQLAFIGITLNNLYFDAIKNEIEI